MAYVVTPAHAGDRHPDGARRAALDDPQVGPRRRAALPVAGLAIGLIGAWGLAGLVSGFLFEIQPHDPWVYAGVLLVLAMTGLAAAFVPARRAARVDPLVALRME